MTDKTRQDSGSTHIIRYALKLGLLWIDGDGRDKVRRSPAASLSDATARSIREDYAQGGVSYTALAKRYGTNKRTVGRIISGETYV